MLRVIQSSNFTRKVMERRHIRQDPRQRLDFYNRIAFVNPDRLVDIDEMSCNPEAFLQRHGYSLQGTAAIRMQIKIGTKQMNECRI